MTNKPSDSSAWIDGANAHPPPAVGSRSDDDIFGDALDLPTFERAAYLERACPANTAQRSRLEALLAAYSEADSFLEAPLTARPSSSGEEKTGDVIGRYTLLQEIGEGGCGVVYLAEQKQPVHRRVALKVIKLGMDTRHVIQRFEAERQALALMEHPNIARVFDAGATETGRPYFVMELVEGVPITRYCDEHTLSLSARLELFAHVCAAVQHAHQKGIIHRDLKPSNILVALRDGAPVPVIIDFGIAKATQGRLTEQTLFTRVDQFMGTPAYMSPEQAERRDQDVDTRSDLYSLGVVLYELLTGFTPIDAEMVRHSGLDELRRIIREIVPARPSAHILSLEIEVREKVAQLRRTTPSLLISALRRDLDWIAIRCLEKERSRRYRTAYDLAEDVRRHLRNEPVSARPPQTLYLAQKFIARNRWACASVAAIATSLVAGTVISLRQAVRATRAERRAVIERDAAAAANVAEALARNDAQRRQEQAEGILTFLLDDFRTELKKVGRLDLLNAVGEKALTYFDSLDPRDLTDTALARQAKALTQIGETRFDEARYPEAEKAFTTAYQRAAALALRHPENGDMLFERAQAEYWIGFVHRTRGEFSSAREWFTNYRDSAISLVSLEGSKARAQRELASGHHNLAVLNLDRGNLASARTEFLEELSTIEKLLAVEPNDFSLWFKVTDIHGWLGIAAERSGQYNKAINHFTTQITELEELVQHDPQNSRWQLGVANSLILKARILARTAQPSVAPSDLARAQTLIDSLAAQDTKNRQRILAAADVRLEQAEILLSHRKIALVGRVIEDANRKLEGLVSAAPSDRYYQGRLVTAWRLEAQRRAILCRPESRKAIEYAIQIGESLVVDPQTEDRMVGEFAQCCVLAGQLDAINHELAGASSHWNRAITLLSPRIFKSNNWRLLDPYARALFLQGRHQESFTIINRLQSLGYRPLEPWPAFFLHTQ